MKKLDCIIIIIMARGHYAPKISIWLIVNQLAKNILI